MKKASTYIHGFLALVLSLLLSLPVFAQVGSDLGTGSPYPAKIYFCEEKGESESGGSQEGEQKDGESQGYEKQQNRQGEERQEEEQKEKQQQEERQEKQHPEGKGEQEGC